MSANARNQQENPRACEQGSHARAPVFRGFELLVDFLESHSGCLKSGLGPAAIFVVVRLSVQFDLRGSKLTGLTLAPIC